MKRDRRAPRQHAPTRRAADRRRGERRLDWRRHADTLWPITWEKQRTQYITRLLFGSLGLAYFNLAQGTVRPGWLLVINAAIAVYFVLTLLGLWHARRELVSTNRLRLSLLADVLAVSASIFVDPNAMNPAYLVYLVIVLGNGMRYGVRAFAESALLSLVGATLVFASRFADYNLSAGSAFFILFIGIIVAYSYSLMTTIERARRGLEIASCNDVLTGLLNRRGLREQAERLFRSLGKGHSPLALLFADINGFKAVNDTYGHDAGDRVLKEVARTLSASVRDSDIVARYGGDEFVVLLPETTSAQAARVAKRMQSLVPAAHQGSAPTLTIGIGSVPTDDIDLEAALRSVDAAMYQSKPKAGKATRVGKAGAR